MSRTWKHRSEVARQAWQRKAGAFADKRFRRARTREARKQAEIRREFKSEE